MGLAVWLGGFSCCLGADTWYVDNDGPGDPEPNNPLVSDPLEDGSMEHPFDAIQEATNASGNGDEVVIAPGTYTGTGNRDITYGGRAITVRSVEPTNPEVVAATVIDCEGSESEGHRGFYFGSGDTNSILQGLTIQNGYIPYSNFGGGINCENDASPTIEYCVIRNCQTGYGGGISIGYCEYPVIRDCIFEENTAEIAGGAIFIWEADDIEIQRCVFRRNSITDLSLSYGGGAIYNGQQSDLTVHECLFQENVSRYGGAVRNGDWTSMYIYSSRFEGNRAVDGDGGGIYGEGFNSYLRELEGCSFVGNTANNGGAVAGGQYRPFIGCTFVGNVADNEGGAIWYGARLIDCIVWGNADGSGTGTASQIYPSEYSTAFTSCIQDADPDDGLIPFGPPWNPLYPNGGEENENIDDDPRFVRNPDDGGDGWGVGDNDDYGDVHLRSDSPCIDTGNGSIKGNFYGEDMDGQLRFTGERSDMGADEFTPFVMVTNPQAGDVWAGDSRREITWDAEGLAGNLNLFYSVNNGMDWTAIESNIPNTGSYDWQVPVIDANDCLIKLEAMNPPEYILYCAGGPFMIHTSMPGAPVASSWPTLGKNFQRTGLSDFSGPEIGCVKWHFAADGAIHQGVVSGADGQVHFASEAGTLYTLDPNGILVWSYDAGAEITNTPTVGADGTVYFGCADGAVRAIDRDGQARWTSHISGAVLTSAAIADDGKVFIGSTEGVVYALDPNGIELWQRAFDDEGTKAATFTASPTIGLDGSVYVGALFDPNLYALDPATGDIRWRCPLARWVESEQQELMELTGSVFASPVVAADGTIYVVPMHDSHLLAIDPADGSVLRRSDMADVGAFWAGTHSDSGLIAHWRFDEPNGVIADEDIARRNGTLMYFSNPDMPRPSGRFGNAIDLSGGHIEINDYLHTVSNNIQGVSAWIKTDTEGGVFSAWNEFTDDYWTMWVYNNIISFHKFYGGDGEPVAITAEAPYNLCDGNWHHVAVAVEEGDGTSFRHKCKFYADGIPLDGVFISISEELNTGLLIEATSIYIGDPTYGSLGGLIDDVRIYRGTQYGSYCYSKPAVGADGTIYVSFDDPYLRAVNPDGSFKWITRLGTVGGFTISVGQNGLIYAAADDGSMYVVNAAGEEVSRFDSSDWQRYAVVHYQFDEESGLAARDSLGGKDVTLYNYADDESQWVSGKEGGALQFDGIDDYAEIRDVDDLSGGKSRQVSAWIKTTNAGDSALVSWGRGDEGSFDSWAFWIGEGKLKVSLLAQEPYAEVSGNIFVADGQWHHVRAVYKAKAYKEIISENPPVYAPYDKVELYVDGRPDGFLLAPSQAEYNYGSNKITIGAFWYNSAYTLPFAGIMDELTIGFDLESTLAHAAIGAEGTMYVADSDHRVWALTGEGCSEEDRRLGRLSDFTTDGIVNLFDYAYLGTNWLDCTDPANPLCSEDALYFVGDVNRDGYQDIADLIGFTRQWLRYD